MRWMMLMFLILPLSACLYTEGQIIQEPQDIRVSSNIYQYTPWYPCQGIDVTPSKKVVKCPKGKITVPVIDP